MNRKSKLKKEEIMKTYSEFAPTSFDPKGLNLEDKQNWLVVPVGLNRDSDCLQRSNWESSLKKLGKESETFEIHRFNHWACGWFEIAIVKPDSESYEIAKEIENSLENYPVLDEDDFSTKETDEANDVWKNCYSPKERIEYIRKHESQFEFRSFSDLLGCVKGKYFSGYASELLN